MAEEVRFELRGRAAWVTIDRPERRNALSAGVIDGLLDGLRRAAADEGAAVVVITGAGDAAFCAGGDIGGFGRDTAESAPAAIARLLDALWHHPLPTLRRKCFGIASAYEQRRSGSWPPSSEATSSP